MDISSCIITKSKYYNSIYEPTYGNFLKVDEKDNIKIIGKINILNIDIIYNYVIDLSELDCKHINFINQNGDSTIHYILPDNLEELSYIFSKDDIKNYNKIKINKLPKLPNNLKILKIDSIGISELPNHLPNSLEQIYCNNNEIVELPNHLPNSLIKLSCNRNRLTSFKNVKFPNSLIFLDLSYNEIDIHSIIFPRSLISLNILNINKDDYNPLLIG